ncbi:MAG: hypothetical protein NTX79_01020 [Candidatus Micrarchaeota archaeon]|nr:hypothetical protein [Candidatus Micrarchaeota archaeon]
MLLFQIKAEIETPDALKARMDAAKKAIMADKELFKVYSETRSMLMRDQSGKIHRELADLYYQHPGDYSRLMNAITLEANRLADLDMAPKRGVPNIFNYEQLPFNKEGTAKILPSKTPKAPNETVMEGLELLNHSLYHMLDIMTDYEKFSKFKKQVLKPQLI